MSNYKQELYVRISKVYHYLWNEQETRVDTNIDKRDLYTRLKKIYFDLKNEQENCVDVNIDECTKEFIECRKRQAPIIKQQPKKICLMEKEEIQQQK